MGSGGGGLVDCGKEEERTEICMDKGTEAGRWMNRRMDGWMDGWMDGKYGVKLCILTQHSGKERISETKNNKNKLYYICLIQLCIT